MRELISIYFGTIFLMYLSQLHTPAPVHLSPSGRKSFMWEHTDVYMGICIFWMTCFFFLRTHYNDTSNYIFFWELAPSTQEFIALGGLSDLTGNPLSQLWQALSHDLFSSYHVYFLLPAFVISLGVIKLFRHYSVSLPFSMLVYFSIGTCVMYMAAMKQCMAMFILLLSIPYAEKKQYIRFYLLVFLAILFHTHAFMFAILPFLFGKPWNKITWLGFGAVLFMMATYDQTMGAFMEFAQSLGALVDESELFDGHQINILRVIVYWIPGVLALLFRKRLFRDSSRTENLFVNMTIVSSFILMIGMVQGANLYARMAAYFELAASISMPWMIKKLFAPQSAKIVTVLSGILYFGYFLFEFGVSKSFGTYYRAISLWEFFLELLHLA